MLCNGSHIPVFSLLLGPVGGSPISKKLDPLVQLVEESGFFIGLHTKKINSKLAEYISTNLLMINEI